METEPPFEGTTNLTPGRCFEGRLKAHALSEPRGSQEHESKIYNAR